MAEMLRMHGHDVPTGLSGMVTGRTGMACHALLQRLTGFAPAFEDYVQTKYRLYLDMAPALAMRPGAEAVLDTLWERAVPWAVVSNSDRILVDANLRGRRSAASRAGLGVAQ